SAPAAIIQITELLPPSMPPVPVEGKVAEPAAAPEVGLPATAVRVPVLVIEVPDVAGVPATVVPVPDALVLLPDAVVPLVDGVDVCCPKAWRVLPAVMANVNTASPKTIPRAPSNFLLWVMRLLLNCWI